jgi:hypothetical protein
MFPSSSFYSMSYPVNYFFEALLPEVFPLLLLVVM